MAEDEVVQEETIQPSSSEGKSLSKPLLFISHRHADEKIASTLRNWVAQWSLGGVRIFQSSAIGGAPQIGGNLNQALMDGLDEAQSVVLIYTTTDYDWSYCMWECGIATDPRKPDTKVIVFQCSGDVPNPFQDKIRINIHDRVSLTNFVFDFLTNPTFFPRYGRAVAPNFDINSPQVERASNELYRELQLVSPPLEVGKDEEWSAFASISLEISLNDINDKITNTENFEERLEAVKGISSNGRLIVRGSNHSASILFGMPSIVDGTPFNRLLSTWREKYRGADEEWLTSLLGQIGDACSWQYPQTKYTLMKQEDNTWYIPSIYWVRKLPSLNCMRFEIHFFPLEVGRGQEQFQIPIPR